MATKQICILGSSGGQGQAILKAALDAGYTCTILQRASSSLSMAKLPSTKIIIGDLEDSHTVHHAIENADVVVLTIPLTFNADQMQWMAEISFAAVSQQRIRRFIFNASTVTPDQDTDSKIINTYRRIAQSAARVRSAVTVIRPTLFLENLLAPWAMSELVERGVISTAIPVDHSVPWISQRELGRLAVSAIRTDELIGHQVDVGGAESVTGDELANRIGHSMQMDLRFESITPTMLSNHVLPYTGIEVASEIGQHYAHYVEHSDSHQNRERLQNRQRFGRFQPDSIDAWTREVLAQPFQRATSSLVGTAISLDNHS